MMEAIRSSETSVLTKVTCRHTPRRRHSWIHHTFVARTEHRTTSELKPLPVVSLPSFFSVSFCVELRRYGWLCCDVTTEAGSGVWFIIMVRPLSSHRPPTQRRCYPERRMTKNGNLERVMRLANIKGYRTWRVNHVMWDRARVRYIILQQGVYKVSSRTCVPTYGAVECAVIGCVGKMLSQLPLEVWTRESYSLDQYSLHLQEDCISIPGGDKEISLVREDMLWGTNQPRTEREF
jgi:hypothetical protein